MSFAFDIKKELLSKELSIDNAQAFVAGLITVAGIRDGSKIVVKLNNPETSHVIKDLLTQLKIKNSRSAENKNFIIIENFEPTTQIKLPAYFFAGAFVGGGSISDSQSTSYHLEIQLYSHQNALLLQGFLNKYPQFNFTLIPRRAQWVLYLKKSEQISDFIRAVEAIDSLMVFENKRIERDFKNQLNRYSNLDVYNQQKMVDANFVFKEQFEIIKARKLMKLFTQNELSFYQLKYDNEFSSLSELTELFNEQFNTNKTRGGLNHWLIKLRQITDELKR